MTRDGHVVKSAHGEVRIEGDALAALVLSAAELVDGARVPILNSMSTTLFWTLDARDKALTTAHTLEPPADPDAGILTRLMLPVRHAGRTRGYLWLLDGGRIDPTDIADPALAAAVDLARAAAEVGDAVEAALGELQQRVAGVRLLRAEHGHGNERLHEAVGGGDDEDVVQGRVEQERRGDQVVLTEEVVLVAVDAVEEELVRAEEQLVVPADDVGHALGRRLAAHA